MAPSAYVGNALRIAERAHPVIRLQKQRALTGSPVATDYSRAHTPGKSKQRARRHGYIAPGTNQLDLEHRRVREQAGSLREVPTPFPPLMAERERWTARQHQSARHKLAHYRHKLAQFDAGEPCGYSSRDDLVQQVELYAELVTLHASERAEHAQIAAVIVAAAQLARLDLDRAAPNFADPPDDTEPAQVAAQLVIAPGAPNTRYAATRN